MTADSTATRHPMPPIVTYARFVVLAAVFVLGFLVFRHFLVTFTVAASVGLLLYPLQVRLVRRRLPPSLAAALIVTFVLVLLVLPVATYLTLIAKQAVVVYQAVRPSLEPDHLRAIWMEGVLGRLPLDENRAAALLSAALSRLADGANRVLQRALTEVAGLFLQMLLFLLMLFFLLRDGGKLGPQIRRLSPFSERRERQVTSHLTRTVKGVLAAMLVVPVVQGLTAIPGFVGFGLPAPLFWSAMVVFSAFIPLVGAPLIWVPASIYMMISVSTGRGIGLFLYGLLVIGAIDNLIKPLVLGGTAGIHPLLGFLSIAGGILSFGAPGLLVGPVILSLVLSALRIYARETDAEPEVVAPEGTASSPGPGAPG